MAENFIDDFSSFYFLGIGGVSMSALAKILMRCGKRIGGCDRTQSDLTDELISLGARVEITTSGDAKDFDAVVYTDAVSESNSVLVQARRMKKTLIPRGRLLAEVCKLFKTTVAVAGCHGKTTCTAMLAHILGAAGVAFSSHIGGEDPVYSNGYMGGFDYFVTEACEYRKNFLYLRPDVGVVLNTDADHLDCYSSAGELRAAYGNFASLSGQPVILYGDFNCEDAITFGFDDRADYYAKRMRCVGGRFSFTVYEGDTSLGKINLNTFGKHNVLNALAAVAVSRRLGIGFDRVSEGLNKFTGVKRRFEFLGSRGGATCVADYAHHPNEIKAVLKAAKLITEGELYVVFQPHTYSRTKNLFGQFVLALSQIKRLMIYKTYAAREYYDDAGSALTLTYAVKRALYGDCESDIARFIEGAGAGDTVLFLGAGDIYETALSVMKN